MLDANSVYRCDAEVKNRKARTWRTCQKRAAFEIDGRYHSLHYCIRHKSHINNPVYMVSAGKEPRLLTGKN